MKIGQEWIIPSGELVTILDFDDEEVFVLREDATPYTFNKYFFLKEANIYVAKGQVWQLSITSSNSIVTIDKVFEDTRNINFIRENGETGRITEVLFEQIATRIE